MYLMPVCLDEGVGTPANQVKNELVETFPGSAIVNISVSYASPNTGLQRFSRKYGRNKYLVNQMFRRRTFLPAYCLNQPTTECNVLFGNKHTLQTIIFLFFFKGFLLVCHICFWGIVYGRNLQWWSDVTNSCLGGGSLKGRLFVWSCH